MKKVILLALLISLLILILGMREKEGSHDPQPRIKIQIPAESKPDLAVTVTAYSPTEEECDDDPFITAFQKPVREGTIAISRDLEEEFGWRPGDRIHLEDLGVFVVWDRMAPRWKKRVDIFFHDTERAVLFGIREARVIKVEKQSRSQKRVIAG